MSYPWAGGSVVTMTTHHRDQAEPGARKGLCPAGPGREKGSSPAPPPPPATYLCTLLFQQPHLLLSRTQGPHLWGFTCRHTSLRRNRGAFSRASSSTSLTHSVLLQGHSPLRASPRSPASLPSHPPVPAITECLRDVHTDRYSPSLILSGSEALLTPAPSPQTLLSLFRLYLCSTADCPPLLHTSAKSPLKARVTYFLKYFIKCLFLKYFIKRYTNKDMCACVISTCISLLWPLRGPKAVSLR